MNQLEVEPLDLGTDVRSVGIELFEDDENREPVRGSDAARIWSRVLPAIAGQETWALDFFSHVDRVRDYCTRHAIPFRDASRSIIIPAPKSDELEFLLDRFQNETFGVRAGGAVDQGDPALEGELARRGVDAYEPAVPNYFFCAVCDFEDGSLVVLSDKLWASEIIRRVKPALEGLEVGLRLPA